MHECNAYTMLERMQSMESNAWIYVDNNVHKLLAYKQKETTKTQINCEKGVSPNGPNTKTGKGRNHVHAFSNLSSALGWGSGIDRNNLWSIIVQLYFSSILRRSMCLECRNKPYFKKKKKIIEFSSSCFNSFLRRSLLLCLDSRM